MATITNEAIQVFTEFIDRTHSVLKLSRNEIAKSFSDNPSVYSEYHERGKITRVMEIGFDDAGATIVCWLDETELCTRSFLFVDGMENIDDYLDYFSNTLDYNFLKNAWVMSEGYMRIELIDEEYSFMCFL